MPKNFLGKLLLIFLIWRVSLFLVAYISPLLIKNFGARFPYYNERLIATGLPHFVWSFGNFDGVHYLGIAKDAYAYQYTQAFFPFYPILIKLISHITFGNLLISGLLISNVSFFIALILFYKLIEESKGEKIAFWSCLFLLAFPTSFYLGAVYTEGLFFLLVIASFYFFERERILLGSFTGAFASGTRLVGLLLIFASGFRKNIKSLLPLFIIPLGFLSYVIYLKIKFNNPLYFLTSQEIFGQGRAVNGIILLPQVIYRYFKIFTTASGVSLINSVFEFLMTIIAFFLLIVAFRKIKNEWLLFGFLAALIPTMTGTLASMPRYVLVSFPIYLTLGSIKSAKLKIILLLISSVTLLVATAFFTQGYWVA